MMNLKEFERIENYCLSKNIEFSLQAYLYSLAADAWEEWKHPRDKEGKFTEKGTGVSKSGGEHGRGQKEGSGVSKSGGEQGRGRSTPRLQQQTSPSPFMLRAVKRNPYGQLSPEAVKRIVQKARKVAQKLKRIGRVQNPKTIAGAKQGKPMTFEQADGGRANPNFGKGKAYERNCQSSVVAHEARIRGYNVQAAPNYETGKTNELAHAPFRAWLNPITGRECKGTKLISSRAYDLYTTLNDTVKKGQRYHFEYFAYSIKYSATVGHIVTLDRDKNGNLRLYDPQNNKTFIDKEVIDYIEARGIYLEDATLCPQILRVDNKSFNPYYINDVLKKY